MNITSRTYYQMDAQKYNSNSDKGQGLDLNPS